MVLIYESVSLQIFVSFLSQVYHKLKTRLSNNEPMQGVMFYCISIDA